MIIGIGIDIVEIPRVEAILKKYQTHLPDSILVGREFDLLETKKTQKAAFLAGRWAAKEAFSKAIGFGMREECSFLEIEIVNNEWGAPVMALQGQTAISAKKAGIKKIHLSISHEKNYAAANVLLEG